MEAVQDTNNLAKDENVLTLIKSLPKDQRLIDVQLLPTPIPKMNKTKKHESSFDDVIKRFCSGKATKEEQQVLKKYKVELRSTNESDASKISTGSLVLNGFQSEDIFEEEQKVHKVSKPDESRKEMQSFLEEKTERDEGKLIMFTDMQSELISWCRTKGIKMNCNIKANRLMRDLGLEETREADGMAWKNIKFKQSPRS